MTRGVVPVVGTVLEALRDVFCNEEKPPLGGVTMQPQHRPGGDVALDWLWEDGCDGLVWVNVVRLYRTTSFPAEADQGRPCSGPLVAVLQVGVARCVATLDDGGRPPSPDDMERDALVGLDDAVRLEAALCRARKWCEERELVTDSVHTGVEPIGPSGGSLVWVQTWTVQLQ